MSEEPNKTTEKPELETIEYKRPNGMVKVIYGIKVFKEDEPNLLMREICEIEFTPKDGEPIDLLERFNIPNGWSIMSTNDRFSSIFINWENEIIRLSSREFDILFEEEVPTPESLEEAKQKIQNKIGANLRQLNIQGRYLPEEKKLLAGFIGKFFERPGAFLLFLHELDHTRRNYTKDILKKRAKLRKIDPQQMNFEDMNDYHRLVISDEDQANKSAVQTILELREKNIDLEPGLSTKEALEEFIYKTSLTSYEDKLDQALERKAV